METVLSTPAPVPPAYLIEGLLKDGRLLRWEKVYVGHSSDDEEEVEVLVQVVQVWD